MVEFYFVGFDEADAIKNGPVTYSSAVNSLVINMGLSLYRAQVHPADVEKIKVH